MSSLIKEDSAADVSTVIHDDGLYWFNYLYQRDVYEVKWNKAYLSYMLVSVHDGNDFRSLSQDAMLAMPRHKRSSGIMSRKTVGCMYVF